MLTSTIHIVCSQNYEKTFCIAATTCSSWSTEHFVVTTAHALFPAMFIFLLTIGPLNPSPMTSWSCWNSVSKQLSQSPWQEISEQTVQVINWAKVFKFPSDHVFKAASDYIRGPRFIF